MTSLLASIRPDSWNFPLFLHVLGAMVLVGAVTTAVVAQLTAGGTSEPDRMRRFSFRTLLLAAIPAYIVMRIGAEWLYSKEFGDTEDDPTWIGIGYGTADAGALVLLIAVICAGIASWKSKSGLAKASGIIAAIALAGWIVTIWAMGAKPTERQRSLKRPHRPCDPGRCDRLLPAPRTLASPPQPLAANVSAPNSTSRASSTDVSTSPSARSACRIASSSGQPNAPDEISGNATLEAPSSSATAIERV